MISGVGYSTARDPRSAAAEATAAALAQAGISRATGAMCFATPAYGAAYPMILRTVASEAPRAKSQDARAWASSRQYRN